MAGPGDRVLVTGATGLIGRHVLPLLAARGFEVHAAARGGPDGVGAATWHVLDLSDHARIEQVVAAVRPTHLLHLAWHIRGDYYTSPANIRWLRDSLRLFEVFVEHGGRRLVGAGTASEYEHRGDADLSETVTPLRPNALYGECKKALGEVAAAYASRCSVSFAWGRVFPCYGPGEHRSRMIPTLLDVIATRGRIPFEEGRGVRDYVYVEDTAEAFAELVASRVEGPLNIGTGVPTTVRDFVTKLAAAAGRPGCVDFGAAPTPSYEPVRIVADTARVRALTSWRPRWSVEAGIRETVAWWTARGRSVEVAAGRTEAT